MYLSEGHRSVNKEWFDELASSYRVNRGKIKENSNTKKQIKSHLNKNELPVKMYITQSK
jgi:hypothetical protein